MASDQWRDWWLAVGGQGQQPGREDGQGHADDQPGDRATDGQPRGAGEDQSSERRGGDALGLEIGELATLVAQVRDGPQDHRRHREDETRDGRDHEGPDDALAQGVTGAVGDQVRSGGHRGEPEGIGREGRADLGQPTGIIDRDPHLRRSPGSRDDRGEGDQERIDGHDDEARRRVHDGREPVGRPDDAQRDDRVSADVQLEPAVGVGDASEVRADDRRDHQVVRLLWRAQHDRRDREDLEVDGRVVDEAVEALERDGRSEELMLVDRTR